MAPTMHNDVVMFTLMTRWAAGQPREEWHRIERDRVHPQSVISTDLPPYGVSVFLHSQHGIGTGGRVLDVYGLTWMGIGVDGVWADEWMAIPE